MTGFKATPFAIGSDTWPGIAKLQEECAEVGQVCAKLVATGGHPDHWDGTNLITRLEEEIGDAMAAIRFLVQHNKQISSQRIDSLTNAKLDTFTRWHFGNYPLPSSPPPAEDNENDKPPTAIFWDKDTETWVFHEQHHGCWFKIQVDGKVSQGEIKLFIEKYGSNTST